jgi:hypothetical protein
MEEALNSKSEPQKLELDHEALNSLKETRKWTNFLAILGFIFIGFLLIFAVVIAGASTVAIPKTAFVSGFSLIILIILAIVYFFPIYYLLRFSAFAKQAINNLDSGSLTEALKYLRFHYRYMGILVIVVLGIYILAFLTMLLSGRMLNTVF